MKNQEIHLPYILNQETHSMTTVKQFKEWLNQFPDDTIVEVPICIKNSIKMKSIEFSEKTSGCGWEFLDFRNNQFTKPDEEHYNKTYLQLGESH